MRHARAGSRFFLALLVVVFAQAVAPGARAYEEGRSEYGARLHLTLLPARVRLATPVPGFSDGGRGALSRAMKTWSGTFCAGFGFVETNEGEEASIEVRAVAEGWRHGKAIAAHTDVESDPWSGEIRRVVIELDATRRWSDAPRVPADGLDLETVLLHELGHAAGLAHSGQTSAVMRAGLKPGHVARRALDPDDVAGICATYAAKKWVRKDERAAGTNVFPRTFGVVAALVTFGAIGAIGAGLVQWRARRRRRGT